MQHPSLTLATPEQPSGFTSNAFQAEVPEGFESWADYLDAKILTLTSAAVSGAFTKGCESIQLTASLPQRSLISTSQLNWVL